MLWTYIAVSAYFLLALVAIIDKKLLTYRIPHPISYAFFVGILNIFVLFLVPFGFSFLEPHITLFALVSGIAFVVGIYLLYTLLKKSEASRIVPLIGAATPLFLILFSTTLTKSNLVLHEFAAMGLFITGGLLLSYQSSQTNGIPFLIKIRSSFPIRIFFFAFLASFFFASSLFLTKEVFNAVDFIPGFIWTRLGAVLAALSILLFPSARYTIFHMSRRITSSSTGMFLSNQALGSTSTVLLHIAIFLGPVTIINAMQGVQYFFIFFLALFSTAVYPRLIRETFTPLALVSKFIGIVLIAAGFAFLFLY